MANARQAYLRRLDAFRRAVNSPTIVDQGPTEAIHNAQARLLRNGLGVVGFALLEDFLRSRSGEILAWLSHQHLPYGSLPVSLQQAASDKTVRGLAAQYDIVRRRGGNIPTFLADVGSAFASLVASATTFSQLALGWRGSNLGAEEVKDMLGAFEVKDGWGNIEQLAGRVGLGSLTARASFENALQARHVAAHQATANIQPTDLQYFARDALGIALGYDAVVSRAARLVAEGGTGAVATGRLQDTIRIRFLEKDGPSWRERLDHSTTTIRRERYLGRLESAARKRARVRHDLIVVLDKRQSPYRWTTMDVQ